MFFVLCGMHLFKIPDTEALRNCQDGGNVAVDNVVLGIII